MHVDVAKFLDDAGLGAIRSAEELPKGRLSKERGDIVLIRQFQRAVVIVELRDGQLQRAARMEVRKIIECRGYP